MLSRDEIDLEDLVQRAAQRASLQPENKLKVQIEANLPALFADRPRLETILRNLLENSVKYAGESATIKVDINREDDQMVFQVSDNGPGIPADESQRIFESFYQVNADLARISSGTGLGLAICQGLVHAHGGEIFVDEREEGACVTFSIPLNLQVDNAKSYDETSVVKNE